MALITDGKIAHDYVLDGNSIFSIGSKKTGTKFIYRVLRSEDRLVWLVSHIEDSKFDYFGTIYPDGQFSFALKVETKTKAMIAFEWTWVNYLSQRKLSDTLEIWPEE